MMQYDGNREVVMETIEGNNTGKYIYLDNGEEFTGDPATLALIPAIPRKYPSIPESLERLLLQWEKKNAEIERIKESVTSEILPVLNAELSQYPSDAFGYLVSEELRKVEGQVFKVPTYIFISRPGIVPGSLFGGMVIETTDPTKRNTKPIVKATQMPLIPDTGNVKESSASSEGTEADKAHSAIPAGLQGFSWDYSKAGRGMAVYVKIGETRVQVGRLINAASRANLNSANNYGDVSEDAWKGIAESL